MNSTTVSKTNSVMNITSSYLSKALRYMPSTTADATTEEINMMLGDPNPTLINFNLVDIKEGLEAVSFGIFVGATAFIILTAIINEMMIVVFKNGKYQIPNPITELKKYYKQRQIQLPLYRPKKAKESPFIKPEIPPVLPNCPRLDGAEKGQNVFSLPYRRLTSRDRIMSDEEIKITITATVEGPKSSPKP